jgi:hypothetical protein
MGEERSNLTVRVRLAAEEIIDEARRWDVSNEVGLRVLDSAATSVMASSPRGRQFLEHLVSLHCEREPRAGQRPTGARSPAPVFRAIPSGAWIEIVKLAEKITGDVTSRRRVDTAVALKLARAVRALSTPDESTSGIIARPAGLVREPQ